MRYGEIARKIREESARLNALADELERIEEATPKIVKTPEKTPELSNTKMLMSVKETAEALGLSRPMVYNLIHRNDFPSLKIGSRTLVNVKKLQEWLDNQSEEWID